MLHYKRLHWFPFCPNDWMAKTVALGLSIPAEGCLIALCSIQWIEGSIPGDRELIIRCLRGYNGPGIVEALSVFVHKPDDSRRLYYPLLESIRQEVVLANQARSKAGRKGALAKAAKRMAKHDPTSRESRN